MAPFSIDATRSAGNRDSRPWQTMEASVSEMPRSAKATSGNDGVLEALEPAATAGVAGAPEPAVVADTAEPGVQHHRHARLGDQPPDAVELGVRRARRSRRRRRGPGRGS